MDKEKKELVLKKLDREKNRILNIINKMENKEGFGAMDEYYTELSFYDNHPADLGTEMFMMEQDKGLIDKLNNTLYEIERSIEELKAGTYGLCNLCGRKIDEERLELIPYLKLCINCAREKIPIEDKMGFRPEEEESISPFTKFNRKDSGFDREDSYQEVDRYNRIDNDPSYKTGDDMGVYDDEGSGAVEDVERISQEYYYSTKE